MEKIRKLGEFAKYMEIKPSPPQVSASAWVFFRPSLAAIRGKNSAKTADTPL
jgi:hypothetical protein